MYDAGSPYSTELMECANISTYPFSDTRGHSSVSNRAAVFNQLGVVCDVAGGREEEDAVVADRDVGTTAR
jgi:hypothetical protein